MLKTHTFRMNSIICQSDETESLYFGDFLCSEYENDIDRLRGYLKESNILISSFTNVANDSAMWDMYGDGGEGVMLGFESNSGDILTSIQYIDEELEEFKLLRANIRSFKENNIRLHFTEIDNMHRFIKNIKFKEENEWRLVREFMGDLDNTLYNNTYAYFHDFPFTGNKLNDLNMSLVSITLGPNQRKSNIPLLIKDTQNAFGNIEITAKIQNNTSPD